MKEKKVKPFTIALEDYKREVFHSEGEANEYIKDLEKDKDMVCVKNTFTVVTSFKSKVVE